MKSAAASLLSSRYIKPFVFFYAGVFVLLFLYLHGTTHPDSHAHQGHHVRGVIDHRGAQHRQKGGRESEGCFTGRPEPRSRS